MRNEDDLKAALSILERHAPDPATVLSAVRASAAADQPQSPRRRAALRWLRLVTPLAAAVAVLAILAGSLALTSDKHRGQATGRGSASAASPLASVPPYYVTLDESRAAGWSMRQQAAIRATATGKLITRIAVPAPYNTVRFVTVAADDRTFVLLAQRESGRSSVMVFFLVRFTAATAAVRVTALPIATMSAQTAVSGIALSPDASQLAVAIRGSGPGQVRDARILVYSVATGASRTWTWPGGGPIDNNGGTGQVLSWAADSRTLAFQQRIGDSIYIRMIDTASPGDSLKSSRLAKAFIDQAETWKWVHNKIVNAPFGFNILITPDGSKVVAATASESRPPVTADLAFTEFSTSTGQPVAVLGKWHLNGDAGQTQDVLWTDSTGRTLIVIAHKPGSKQVRYPGAAAGNRSIDYSLVLGIQRGNQFTQLPESFMRGPFNYPVW
jgi:hypothetical protein